MAAATKTTAPAKNPYAALIGGNAVFAGVDQGIDFTGKGPVYAVGEGQVTSYQASGSGWPGEGAKLIYALSGANAGKNVYVAEDFKAAAGIAQGSLVHRGEVIGYATGSGLAPGIEVGYADASGHALEPLLPKGSTYPSTGYGAKFNQDVQALSAGAGGGGFGSTIGNLLKIIDGTDAGQPNPLQSPTKIATSLEQTGKDVAAPFVSAVDFFHWITNPKNMIRIGEMIGGGIFIMLGVVMVGRAASSSGPAKQVTGAAETVAAVTPARAVTRAAKRRSPPQRTSRQAKPKMRSHTLPVDRKPKRGQPGSSRLAKGDSIPF
jgi:hypothetical protein